AIVALGLGRIEYVSRPVYDYMQHGGNVIGHQASHGWRLAQLMGRLLKSAGTPHRVRKTLEDTYALGREVYFTQLLPSQQLAWVLEMRAGSRLNQFNRHAVQRAAHLSRTPSHWPGLAGRWLRKLGPPTETLQPA